MKVVTIGKQSDNNIVINDDFVSRHHCQIIQNNDLSYMIVDVGSKNGTYVNGNRINGSSVIHSNDIIRIGNTTLPWQIYFNNSQPAYNDNHSSKHKAANNNSNIQQPFIPSNINIKQDNKNENVNINADVYKSGDDFKVPFKRNVGNHVGNAVGQVGGCLIWVIAIALIGGIIALCV